VIDDLITLEAALLGERMVQHLIATSNSLPDIAACGLELQHLSTKILSRISQERPDVVIGARSPQPRRAVFATH
jgi:hypothetical protein